MTKFLVNVHAIHMIQHLTSDRTCRLTSGQVIQQKDELADSRSKGRVVWLARVRRDGGRVHWWVGGQFHEWVDGFAGKWAGVDGHPLPDLTPPDRTDWSSPNFSYAIPRENIDFLCGYADWQAGGRVGVSEGGRTDRSVGGWPGEIAGESASG